MICYVTICWLLKARRPRWRCHDAPPRILADSSGIWSGITDLERYFRTLVIAALVSLLAGISAAAEPPLWASLSAETRGA